MGGQSGATNSVEPAVILCAMFAESDFQGPGSNQRSERGRRDGAPDGHLPDVRQSRRGRLHPGARAGDRDGLPMRILRRRRFPGVPARFFDRSEDDSSEALSAPAETLRARHARLRVRASTGFFLAGARTRLSKEVVCTTLAPGSWPNAGFAESDSRRGSAWRRRRDTGREGGT